VNVLSSRNRNRIVRKLLVRPSSSCYHLPVSYLVQVVFQSCQVHLFLYFRCIVSFGCSTLSLTTRLSSISESPKLWRLKARRCSNCLVASDTSISFRKTVTSSSRKLTILCKRWEHRQSHPCVTISAKATTTRLSQRRIRFPASSAIDCAALTEYNNNNNTKIYYNAHM